MTSCAEGLEFAVHAKCKTALASAVTVGDLTEAPEAGRKGKEGDKGGRVAYCSVMRGTDLGPSE